MASPGHTMDHHLEQLHREAERILRQRALDASALDGALDTAIGAFAQHALDAAAASSDGALADQRTRLGDCLRAVLPLASAGDTLAVECMYLRAPFGPVAGELRREIQVQALARPQNRAVIAMAQTSGAGKTKAALSAAMCQGSFEHPATGGGGAGAAGDPTRLVAVYALMANKAKPSLGVQAYEQCVASLQAACGTYCNRHALSSGAGLEVARFFDGLYLRLFELFLATFVRRAKLLLDAMRTRQPSVIDRPREPELLVRAQFVSQDYANISSGPDAIEQLFNRECLQALSASAWSKFRHQWTTDADATLGEFYVVYDEVCTLLPLCPGLCLHQSDIGSASDKSAEDILDQQARERTTAHSRTSEERTSMFYMLRRFLCEETSRVHVMIDTHYRIWKPLLDSIPTSARLTIMQKSRLPAMTPENCLKFLRFHFHVEPSVEESVFEKFAGRPYFFFDSLLPALIMKLVHDRPTSLSASYLAQVCHVGFAAAVQVQTARINHILANKAETCPNDPSSTPSALFTRAYVRARLANGIFTSTSVTIMNLLAMGMVCLPDHDLQLNGPSLVEANLALEPIMWAALPKSELGDDADVEQDLCLKYLAQETILTKADAKRAGKGYSAESALAWALMRARGQKLVDIGSGVTNDVTPSTLAWVHTLMMDHDIAVSQQGATGCCLFALHNEGDVVPGRSAKLQRPGQSIVFPQETMGPDLVLYFPPSATSSPPRAFPVMVCIQAKAKETTSLQEALFTVNPGMFYASNRGNFQTSPLRVAPAMAEWTAHHPSHADMRFVRVLFSVRPFPKNVVELVDHFNRGTGELGEKHPILLLESSAALWSSAIHAALLAACTPQAGSKSSSSWSAPLGPSKSASTKSRANANNKRATLLQYAYPTEEEAHQRRWKYIQLTKEKNAILESKLVAQPPPTPTPSPSPSSALTPPPSPPAAAPTVPGPAAAAAAAAPAAAGVKSVKITPAKKTSAKKKIEDPRQSRLSFGSAPAGIVFTKPQADKRRRDSEADEEANKKPKTTDGVGAPRPAAADVAMAPAAAEAQREADTQVEADDDGDMKD